MMLEGQKRDQKSLRLVSGNSPDLRGLATDCVAFANSVGGTIAIGIENGDVLPPDGQSVPPYLVDYIRKRIGELTVGVTVRPEISVADNKAEFIELKIAKSDGAASTTDGKFYVRIGDSCKPILGDEILRLANERAGYSWESQTSLGINRDMADPEKVEELIESIKSSDRVKPSVKQKTSHELLDHYHLAEGDFLTNLGLLCVGNHHGRARLGTAPIVQFIKYNEYNEKRNKISWDDHSLNPIDLSRVIWSEIPDFLETFEVSSGMYRRSIPVFAEELVRELLVNAFVHRPYTQRGGVYIKLYLDRLEITNPGRLPLGVTPQNALHKTVRRNENLARLFHDVGLMEREGSGIDKLYEILLSQGRELPEIIERDDSVTVVVKRGIFKPEIVEVIAKVSELLRLEQRERIALGLIARNGELSDVEFCDYLNIDRPSEITFWTRRLIDSGVVKVLNSSRPTKYMFDFDHAETLAILELVDYPAGLERGIASYIQKMIVEDVEKNPGSQKGDIRSRMKLHVAKSIFNRHIKELIDSGKLISEGARSNSRYWTSGHERS